MCKYNCNIYLFIFGVQTMSLITVQKQSTTALFLLAFGDLK